MKEVFVKRILPLAPLIFSLTVSDPMAGEDSWTTSGPFGGNVRDIIVDPQNRNILYAAVFYTGVFKSTDGGRTWTKRGAEVIDGGYDLKIDPKDSNLLYLSAFDGVYKSVDAGEHWFYPGRGIVGNVVDDIAINPFNSQELLAACGRLYQSADGGQTWNCSDQNMEDFFTINDIAIDPEEPETIYAVGWNIVGTGLESPSNPSCALLHANEGISQNKERYL